MMKNQQRWRRHDRPRNFERGSLDKLLCKVALLLLQLLLFVCIAIRLFKQGKLWWTLGRITGRAKWVLRWALSVRLGFHSFGFFPRLSCHRKTFGPIFTQHVSQPYRQDVRRITDPSKWPHGKYSNLFASPFGYAIYRSIDWLIGNWLQGFDHDPITASSSSPRPLPDHHHACQWPNEEDAECHYSIHLLSLSHSVQILLCWEKELKFIRQKSFTIWPPFIHPSAWAIICIGLMLMMSSNSIKLEHNCKQNNQFTTNNRERFKGKQTIGGRHFWSIFERGWLDFSNRNSSNLELRNQNQSFR